MARRYETFLAGELIDLCPPSDAAIEDGWADWFNRADTTRFLGQGVFPNSREAQLEFIKGLGRSRLALMICDKAGQRLWGTISLSSIDWIGRSAQIALVLPPDKARPPLAALEAMARMTEHAFETMGLERVWAGQAYPGLAKWNQRLELLGYRSEGVLRRAFAKGRQVSDTVMISVLYEDYRRIREARAYWPGAAHVAEAVKNLPIRSLADRMAEAIRREQSAYEIELAAAKAALSGR